MPSARPKGDLSITALYTSQAWAWAKLPCAELFVSPDGERAFGLTNGALKVAKLFAPDSKSLPHSLVHRHAMIDHLLAEGEPAQVLELAAGLSRRGAATTANPDVTYTEVDLPHVMQKKRALLERSDAGRAVLARPNLHLVSADVTALDLAIHVTPGAPLFVIAEGLLMYLQATEQRQLWSRVFGLFRLVPQATFVFDLVPEGEKAKAGRAGKVLEALMKRFTKGETFAKDDRTRSDMKGELRAIGYPSVTCIEPKEVGVAWRLPFADVPTEQLLFVCRSE